MIDQTEKVAERPPKPDCKRRLKFSEVAFTREGKQPLPIPAVTEIRSWQRDDGRVECHVTTMDLAAAKALPFCMLGLLTARFQDAFNDMPDQEITELGYFQVTGIPYYNASRRKYVATATIRFIEPRKD